ncbi:transcription initiation factor TFIID subunit 3 [Pieris rapae]|uniref:transcription initiation factor TFIID subunit 3 n=1 Tax=Pieris rapae TaxID=64459 RepID=UPI001E2809D8|nr:transcription initiation factor TFIID subunit 3 [Pieris rapae]
MSEAYAREVLRRNVAQICQTIGWNGINSTPLDILVHVLEKYICALGTQANKHAEQFNRTEPTLDDLGLVFRDLHVQLPELAEYTRCVPPVPPPVQTERFPKPKESNLNFLKPGSHEVVTRPMHVHEHLPPMYPEKERDTPAVAGTVEICQNGFDGVENASCASPEISVTDSPDKTKDIFKRPNDPVSLPNSKRPRLRLDEEERTREISSVMMTMSGFLSPAREGKLPEARPPTIISEKHHDRHKVNSHHTNTAKVPSAEKSDKKTKKSKLLNGKVMKSKRKDKSHKGESSKSRDNSKLDRYPPGYPPQRSKDIHPAHHNHVTMPAPKILPPPLKPLPLPQSVSSSPAISEPLRPVIKQEPTEFPSPQPILKTFKPPEDAIPVPRKIPISKSPLVSNPLSVNKQPGSSFTPDREIKKEVVDEEEKLASQPDRSKINIFKRISNKSKEDKNITEVVTERLHSDPIISRLQNSTSDESRLKPHENIVNNNNSSPVDLAKEFDIRAHEVIDIDDDSLDNNLAMPPTRMLPFEPKPALSINKSLQAALPKLMTETPKVKKEKKHKDKKDKAAKLEAKLKKQQQLAFEMVHTADKKNIKLPNDKPSKLGRSKKESKVPQLPPGFPFFPTMAPGRGMMPGPGLIPNAGLLGNDFLTGLANNPALRGLHSQNLMSNPFALGGGPGLIPGPSFLPGLPNHLIPNMGNFPHTSRSSSSKIPTMFRRPSLEVIAVENDDDRTMHKSPGMGHEKDRHDKHKSSTIPNILQKQKAKSNKEHKSNVYKMPPVQPDITIELNPPKSEPVRQEPPKELPVPQPVRLPTPEPSASIKNSEPSQDIEPIPPNPENLAVITSEESEISEKRKDKSHKKEKRDKDGVKIKKKKDKKDKSKEKTEKKKDKEERQEIKDRIKKEKKEKKKEKLASNDGLVPKLTLKLGSSNSNSPMPPSSPDTFKLNIKPIKKEDDSPIKDEPVSREHSRSPELAQISALVTRPPKQKNSKNNHVGDPEPQASSSPPASPQRKNRPPSSHAKYKRILFKPLSKKGHVENFDDETGSVTEEASQPAIDKPSGPLPTPYYVDEHGNKVWVCPACGRPDNGSPMIGCDGCDGWYHWICVGITEEPGATEDWFCKSCLAKRTAMLLAGVTSGKKRGRKPKGEKVRDCHS